MRNVPEAPQTIQAITFATDCPPNLRSPERYEAAAREEQASMVLSRFRHHMVQYRDARQNVPTCWQD